MTVAGWLAAWPALLSQGERAGALLALGAAGLGSLLVGLVTARTAAIGAAVALLGGAYALHLLLDDPPLDTRAALVGAGLLAAAELGSWSIELRREVTHEPGRQLRRLTREIALCLGGLMLSALVLGAADVGTFRGVVVELAGGATAITLAWLALSALRRPL